MAAPPDATSVTPEALALVLLIVTLFFACPSTLVVLLRSYIKYRYAAFGVDDGLMLVGWMLFMMVVGVVSRGAYVGIGTRDEFLNDIMQESGRKHTWLFQMSYCCSLIFIKSSVCVALLRIAVSKTHRLIIWITLVAAFISTLIVIIGLIVMCQPVAANWDSSAGTCSPPVVITSLSYLVSAGAIGTDWVCAILPIFMLYKTQMKLAIKVSITIILGLGILASIATIVRVPYIRFYAYHQDYLYNVGNIVFWSVFESGTGIIAGSLPFLKRLVKRWVSSDSQHETSPTFQMPYTGTKTTVTTGVTKGRRPKDLMSGTKNEGGWHEIDDAASCRKIYVTVDMEMQFVERASASESSGSSEELTHPPTAHTTG